MRDIDFVRDGKVGDKVHDPRYGNGTIETLDETYTRPVCVSFDDIARVDQYDRTGRWSSGHLLPILCWGHFGDLDQGYPPERFEYPLYMKSNIADLIVEFTGLQTGTVLKTNKISQPVGTIFDQWPEHTSTIYWTSCDKPMWKPTKPTWCKVGGSRVKLIHGMTTKGQYIDAQGCRWTPVEPCELKDIPDWWPEKWI